MARRRVTNYLSNKELLKEIHLSKLSFCEFDDPAFSDYDIIVDKVGDVNAELIDQAKKNRANRLNNAVGDKLFEDGMSNKEIEAYLDENGVKPKDFNKGDIVVRVMVDDHIPRIKGKKDVDVRSPVNFPPFQHYIWKDRKWVCVGKSHTKGGKFSVTHGQLTRKLALSYLKIVDRYGSRGNWRNYTWNEEMRGHALVRLSQVGIGFNEAKSANPFAYFTTVITHSFTHVLNKEKEHVHTRNRMIAESGYNPSFNEQAEQDIENYHRDFKPQLVKAEDE
jgi:hypothetical protein